MAPGEADVAVSGPERRDWAWQVYWSGRALNTASIIDLLAVTGLRMLCVAVRALSLVGVVQLRRRGSSGDVHGQDSTKHGIVW